MDSLVVPLNIQLYTGWYLEQTGSRIGSRAAKL